MRCPPVRWPSKRLGHSPNVAAARPDRLQVGSTGLEQLTFRSGNVQVVSKCDAKCDAISADRIELLAHAVVLVAGMGIPEAAREAVLARVTAELANTSEQRPPKSERAGKSTGR